MRVPGLPLVAELGHGSRLSRRDEHRIEAEPLAPARAVRDPPLERAGAALLGSFGRQRDELADVAGTAPLTGDLCELAEEPGDRVGPAGARRPNPGPTSQAV